MMNEGAPLVSVIMITYNHEKFISRAVEGVLMQQTNFFYELIIADDNSPDNTIEIINEIKSRERNKNIINYTRHSKNKGMMPNFIWALNQAQGKYIAICEGDDYWIDPGKLQKQVELIESQQHCTIVWTNFKKLVDGNIIPEEFDVKYANGLYKIELNNVFRPYVTLTLTCLFRRDILDMNLLRNMKFAKDDTLYVMALTKGYGLLMEDVTAVYRIHEGGIFSMRSSFYQAFTGYLTYKEILKHYSGLSSYANINDRKRNLFYWSYRLYFSERRYLKLNEKLNLMFFRQFFSIDMLSDFFWFMGNKISNFFKNKRISNRCVKAPH